MPWAAGVSAVLAPDRAYLVNIVPYIAPAAAVTLLIFRAGRMHLSASHDEWIGYEDKQNFIMCNVLLPCLP